MFRGEGSLGLSSASIIFDLVKEGGLAKAVDIGDTVNSDVIENIVTSAEAIVGGLISDNKISEVLADAVSLLNEEERAEYDSWMRDLIAQLVQRIEGRARTLNSF